MSKKDFIIKTMKHLRLKIRKYTLVDYKNLKNYKCSRPKYMLMNSNKLSKLLNIKIPKLENEIKKLNYEI